MRFHSPYRSAGEYRKTRKTKKAIRATVRGQAASAMISPRFRCGGEVGVAVAPGTAVEEVDVCSVVTTEDAELRDVGVVGAWADAPTVMQTTPNAVPNMRTSKPPVANV
jgi:hypothetical protein